MQTTITVFIADNQMMYKLGLKTVLQAFPTIKLVGNNEFKENWVNDIVETKPDVVLIDLESDSPEITKHILSHSPETAVIFLSYQITHQLMYQLLEAGTMGFVSKQAREAEIMESIQTCYAHKHYFCKISAECLSYIVSNNYQLPTKVSANFTERELQIIERICNEKTSKEIASELHLSKRTVEGHRIRIMGKLGAKCSAGIVTYAIQNGLYHHA